MLDHNVLEQSSRLEAILNPADGRTGCLDDPNVTASEPSKPLRAARKGKPKQTKPRNSSKRLSSASDGLPIVKPSVSTNAIKDVDQNSEVMPLKAQSAVDYESPEPFRLPETTARKLDKFRLDDDFRVEPVKGSTSSAFDHVQVVAPLTTIGSLKAQQGFGCTIYNGSPQTMSSLSFPLMPSSSMRSSPYEDADTNDAAEASIPRKRTRTGPDHILHVSTGTHDAQHACSVAQRRRSFAQSPHLDTIYETSEEGARSGVPPHELDICQQPQRSKASTYQSDDSAFDLSDGDLSDADLLNLLPSESTEPDETQSRNDIAPPQQRSTTTALPTPLQSDPLPSSPLQNACQTSLAGVLGDDDWIELDDDEELARLDLTETSCVRNEHSAQLSSGTAGSVRLVQKSFQLTNDSMEPANAEEHSFDCPIKPVVRPAPPKPIRDRSPIVGATPSTPLRVCFRVGEALNIGAKAVREGNDVILELYARLAASHRETNSVKQHFVFADLWAQRGPRLKGVYEVWKGSDIWDADSRAFLDAHETERLCRCIARMKKENHEWKLTVMNIWEADWDDIEYVHGILTG